MGSYLSGCGQILGKAAERAAQLSKDCELVEQTAIEADAGIYQYILLAVTENVPYHYLRTLKDIPCGYRYFYEKRHKFFYLLAKKRGIL